LSETIDYYPYGAPRFDEKATSFSEGRKYIGEYYDSTSKLSYLNARYYNGNTGRFISEDPVFLSVGSSALKDKKLEKYLSDPQLANSYSYARNNPIVYKDEKGDTPVLAFGLGVVYGMAGQYFGDLQEISAGNYDKRLNFGEYLTSGVKGGAVAVVGEFSIWWGAGAAVVGSALQDASMQRSVSPIKAIYEGATTVVFGGLMKQLPSTVALPKLGSSQFTTESAKTLTRNLVSEVSISNAIAALWAQIAVLQQQINALKG